MPARSYLTYSISVMSCCKALHNYYVFVLSSSQLSKNQVLVSKMAAVYVVDVDSVPVYTQYFDITLVPATVFFFNGQHMKVDWG